ncbi:protein SHQ1 homolog [Nelusetta ayraudi]|uniref:protein SHQ1 homolog n=1 Tax=Nelusetta ayraudi TaxID=303726 RepID=UPI003F7082B9
MITPAFDLSQEPDFLILDIRVPYTRTSEFDLYIDGTDFKFYAKPYFLRLSLPGRIVEDGREKAKFDIDKGLFTVRIPKETAGEDFEGLQLLTSLLAPKGSRSAKPLVEDLSTGCGESAADEEEEEEEEEEEFDWQVEQQVYQENSEEELKAMQTYGFGSLRSGVFARLQEELSDVIDVENPEGTTAAERRRARLDVESAAFSSDHYLADLFEDEEIKGLLKFEPWWAALKPSGDQEGGAAVSFSGEEKEQLRKFTNRSYLLDKASRRQAWLSLVDVLLAYCYDVRATEGEHNVESPWTIRKLSGTLCWLETYSSLQDVLVSFGRRVLCYPLYRHFDMVSAAVGDVATILQSGKACVLRCLLEVHRVFRENEPAYILNDLYVSDYCVWIQRVKSKKLPPLAAALKESSLQKRELGLELEELEAAARMVVVAAAGGDGGESTSASSDEEEDDDEEEEEEEDSSSSSSSSSDESEDCEAGGGGGGGGALSSEGVEEEMCRDNPLQLRSCTAASPAPPQQQHTAEADSSSLPLPTTTTTSSGPPQGAKQLIQELEELTISPSCGSEAESSSSSSSSSGPEGVAAPERRSVGTLLEVTPRRNPLLVVQDQS